MISTSLDRTTGTVFYADEDGDTYGSASNATMSCVIQSGYVTDARDCDDDNSAVNPAATEICDDGLDNDCDGSANTCRLVGDYTMNSDADVYLDGSNVADYAGQALSNLGDWDRTVLMRSWSLLPSTTPGVQIRMRVLFTSWMAMKRRLWI